ncbi:FAD-binding oxidoreductase [Psychrobacter sanguinis]|uniref:L-pipecolate oxidase n=1 Tax=Psychrobacter sanguinis TaxID=861445 RepID=UPI00191AE45F|nr:FAD-binding oxidoreductase [Psychrobacter sanguinis]MCC3346398.1 FAD-binding oxidoreductase [Psychrobacter sanguinis]MDY3306020.1 FAD-binding oxidoreductase [Psychrobacter sanguinis]
MLQEQCLWELIAPTGERFDSLKQDARTQVCIIGAGYTGLSAAIHLAEKGIDVIVLEAKQVGSGGSGRSVGFVNAGTWARPDDLNDYLGEEVGRHLTKELGLAPSLVFDVIDKYKIDAQDTRTGNIHMAHNAAGEKDVDIRYEQLTRLGADVERLTGSECHDYCGTTRINKALLDRRAGTINPQAYVNGLARAAKSLGVKIYVDSMVTSVEKSEGKWYVKTAEASVQADKTIVATNAYTEGEWTELNKTFYLVEYYQIASEPLYGVEADKILPYKTGAWDTRIALSSMRRDKDNRLLLGTVGGKKMKPKSFYQSWANLIQKHYYPNLPKFEWQYEWVGKFGFTQDHIFRVFEIDDSLLAATAYNGRGITTGTMLGKCFAEYILTGDRKTIPLPFKSLEESKVAYNGVRSSFTEMGVSLYHFGQCLRVVR